MAAISRALLSRMSRNMAQLLDMDHAVAWPVGHRSIASGAQGLADDGRVSACIVRGLAAGQGISDDTQGRPEAGVVGILDGVGVSHCWPPGAFGARRGRWRSDRSRWPTVRTGAGSLER